ncbi:MAG: response regulator [Pseudanabaenaceae cyanobacterium]
MNKSNFLKKILGSLPRCFVTIDRDFKILETSYGVERFAETAAMIFRDSDIRHAFPELIGLESAFTEIWNDSGQTLELKGIMRGRGDEVPIYFDLYAVLSEEEQGDKTMVIYLEDVTNIMIKSQNLMQRVNEIELFFSVLSSSKEYIECILTSMADALIVTNQSHRIKIVNPAALDLFGYTKDELIYQYIDQLVVDVAQLEILHKNATQLTMGELQSSNALANHNRCNLEINCLTKDKKQVLIAFSCAQIWIEKEKSYNYIYIGRDITLIHEKEALLRQAKQQAEYSSQAKSIFLANMSHEIRTPMNGVLGMADLLAETQLTNEQKFLVDGIRLSGNILLDLINDILDLAKLEAGQEQVAPAVFDIHKSLDEILEIFALRAHQKGLEINSIIDPNIPHYLLGDSHHLRHVLINLVGNALKFTNKGNILIKLELCPETESQEELQVKPKNITILFSVIDTGIGIPKHAINNLFKPFSQVDTSTTRRFGGTGLGLSICKQLIELMGGRLGVTHNQISHDSEQDLGSCFWFELSFDLPGDAFPNKIREIPKPQALNQPIVIISPHAYSQEALVNQLHMHQVPTVTVLDDCQIAHQINSPNSAQIISVMGMADHSDNHDKYDDQSILNRLHRLELPAKPLGILIDFDLVYQKNHHPQNTIQKALNLGLIQKLKNIDFLGQSPVIAAIRVDQQEHISALLQAGCSNYLVKPFNQKRVITLLNDLLNNLTNHPTAATQSITKSLVVEQSLSLSPGVNGEYKHPDLSQLKILIAEDNKVNQMVVTKQLEKYVNQLDVVPDGQKAVAAWQNKDYDLILMDCQMPVMDGYEAAAMIRQKEQEQEVKAPVVIIAMTANAMAEDRERCLQSGMNDYLSKPLRSGQLTEMLSRWSKCSP